MTGTDILFLSFVALLVIAGAVLVGRRILHEREVPGDVKTDRAVSEGHAYVANHQPGQGGGF